MNQRIPQSPSQNPPTQITNSQLASRPSTVQTKENSPKDLSQSEKEREAFSEDRHEASILQLKAESGTLTSGEEERLGVLQAKMNDFWVQRREKAAQFGHNLANIPISSPQQQDSTVQAKLTIGEPGDKYEREADSVAAKVVNQINSSQFQQQGQAVQRMETLEEEELQTKPEITSLQRMEALEEEEELQAKSILQRKEATAGEEASMDLESAINSARGGGQPLDAGLQQSIGQAMEADFSGVKVHTDSQSDQLNRSIQAKAFTTGQDVFFRQGEYNPGTRGGQELIAHELTHVVQQNGATVQKKPKVSMMSIVQNQLIQRHHGLTYDNPKVVEAEIYGVREKATGKVVYVGQTCSQVGFNERFKQHLASGSHPTWSQQTHEIKRLEKGMWTQFETSCAEQYWIDRYGGKQTLENARNEITRKKFEAHVAQYPKTYRGDNIGFPPGWKPVN